MLYFALTLFVFTGITLLLIQDSYKSHRLLVKNQLINALIDVSIQGKTDPTLLAALTQRGHSLDDEEVLRQIISSQKTGSTLSFNVSQSAAQFNSIPKFALPSNIITT